MKKYFLVILILFFAFFKAENKLLGRWYLDKVTYTTGKQIEINHPLFSIFSSLRFNAKKVFTSTMINEVLTTIYEYKFDGKNLVYGQRKFSVMFADKYLILVSNEDQLMYFYLKGEDFPSEEVEEQKITIKNGDSLFSRSLRYNPYFEFTEGFSDFLRHNMPNYENEPQRITTMSTFIIDKNGKIKDINIIQGKSEKYNSEFKTALLRSQPYWVNPTGKDVLITWINYFRKFGDASKTELKAYRFLETGNKLFFVNKFEEAIKQYNEYLKIINPQNENEDNHFNTLEALKRIGISYLATNQKEKACESFQKAGGIGEFEVRNFTINFCLKQ